MSVRRGRHIASLSLLSALLVGYGVILFRNNDGNLDSTSQSRSLLNTDDPTDSSRVLAKNGDSPPAADEVSGEYIVKPWVGYAATDVWETPLQTRLLLSSAQASTTKGAAYLSRYAIDPYPTHSNQWSSMGGTGDEWLQIDLGIKQDLSQVFIEWGAAYAVNYQIDIASERQNCRADGTSCPDLWVNLISATGMDGGTTTDVFQDHHTPQTIRYVRIKMTQRAAGFDHFSIFYVKIYRKAMISGENPTGISCGATTAAVATSLLSSYGGSLIQTFDNAEFFAASMTEAQKDAMFEDPCTYTVEPNYVVKARGFRNFLTRRDTHDNEGNRKLAIPEFNLRDENPTNWGLERISSHGKRNGKYTWYHEGANTHIYIFDTGVYPDHSDWDRRNGTSRLGSGITCTGSANDYASTSHGTHIASIAAGWTHGTAKSAIIHPVQVLDANGEGTTASVLCGVEQLLQEGKAYNTANAPKKIKSVVNLSLGLNGRSDALDKAVQDMTAVGYTVVIAAGDHGDNACFYSPYDASAITVGALKDHTQGYNDKTATSNYGECVDVWAPGEDIVGASNTGEYESTSLSGTSVAAAFAAGVACLFYEELPTDDYTIDELAARVKEKIINKAEVNILNNIGFGSPSKVLQTTVSKCSLNSHCDVGLTCIFDGTCRNLSKPLKRATGTY